MSRENIIVWRKFLQKFFKSVNIRMLYNLFFMKNFILHQFFGPEAPKSRENYATKSYPELKKLGLSPEQERARAKALAKLDEYINDISKFSRGNKQLSG